MDVIFSILFVLFAGAAVMFAVLWYVMRNETHELGRELNKAERRLEMAHIAQRKTESEHERERRALIEQYTSDYVKAGWDALAELAEHARTDDNRINAAILLIHRESPVAPTIGNPLRGTHG